MRLADVGTPALVLQRPALLRNLDALDRGVARHAMALRPQMQAAKSADVARLVLEGGGAGGRRAGAAHGVVVSTLAEAEYLLAHDVTDMLYAVPVTAAKLDQVGKLNAAGASITVVVVDRLTAGQVAAHPARPRTLIGLEGHERVCCGVPAEDPLLLDIAAALDGLLAGVVIDADGTAEHPPADAARLAEIDRGSLVRAAARLVEAGHAVPVLALSVSWAALPEATLTGITELLAGACLFGGARHPATEPAIAVLACVIGARGPLVLVDCGAVALGGHTAGVGLRDAADQPVYGAAVLRRAWPERATLEIPPEITPPPVGSVVRLLPPDPGLAAAAHDRFLVVDEGDTIAAVWPRVTGW